MARRISLQPDLILAHLVCSLVVVFPLLWISVPVLVDYPNHLARIWLQLHADELGQAAHYRVHWQWLPNMAMELLVPPLARVIPLETAGRMFIATAMLMPCWATAWLRRQLIGQPDTWELGAYLFAYNAAMQWGFANFLFGMGAALLAFAAWRATSRWSMAWRLAVFAPVAVALLLLHLFAFGIYGLLVAAHAAGQLRRDKQWDRGAFFSGVATMLQFAPGLVVWAAIAGGGGPRLIVFGDMMNKLTALAAPMAFGQLGPAIALTLPALLYIAWRQRWISFVSEMRLPLVVIATVAVAMPNVLLGSWQADIRLPIALSFLVLASIRIRPLPRGTQLALLTAGAILLGVRCTALTLQWTDLDRDYQEFRTALTELPKNSRLLVVQTKVAGGRHPVPGMPTLLAYHLNASFYHMASLAVIDRGAFIPTLFTGWTLIRPNGTNASLALPDAMPMLPEELQAALTPEGRAMLAGLRNQVGLPPYWTDWPRRFDHVLWIGPPMNVPSILVESHRGSFFRLYRISNR